MCVCVCVCVCVWVGGGAEGSEEGVGRREKDMVLVIILDAFANSVDNLIIISLKLEVCGILTLALPNKLRCHAHF